MAINRNEKHKLYMQILNTREWRMLRAWKIDQCNGLCEICKREGQKAGIPEGYPTPAKTVHHIVPVESVPDEPKATLIERMKKVCFDKNNLLLLCPNHHHLIHEEMKSHEGQTAKIMPKEENDPLKDADDKLKQWVERNMNPEYTQQPKTKKGIRRTKYGWVTMDEYKQKQQEEIAKWKERINGPKDAERTPGVDAGSES